MTFLIRLANIIGSVEVVRRGFCQRFRGGEQRVGELGRMRQRSSGLWPPSVGHEPAAYGDRDRDQGQQGRDHKGDDKADLGHADLESKNM